MLAVPKAPGPLRGSGADVFGANAGGFFRKLRGRNAQTPQVQESWLNSSTADTIPAHWKSCSKPSCTRVGFEDWPG